MDILSSFTKSKAELDEVSKTLFNMFEANDDFKIIAQQNLSYLEISEHKLDDNLVVLSLYNYRDMSPRVSFDADRNKVLSCDDSMVELWISASLALIEAANVAKAMKFLKDFTMSDHGLIHIIISNYEAMSEAGKSDKEIAEASAKFLTKLIKEKNSQK